MGRRNGSARRIESIKVLAVLATGLRIALSAAFVQAGSQPPKNPPERNRAPLPAQAAADKMEWKWLEARANPEYCAEFSGHAYHIVIEPAQLLFRTLRVFRDGNEVYAWKGHEHSVFVLNGDVLYYADYWWSANGCAVVAYDLKERKRLWKTDLRGIWVQGHSKYRNLVNMEFDGKHIVVYGNESVGRYIELLDPKTGETVGHRQLPKDEKAAPPSRKTAALVRAGSQLPSRPGERNRAPLPAQATVDKMEWKWVEARANPEYCAEVSGRGYKVVIEPAPPFLQTVRLSRDGKELYAWTGHAHSVFVLDRDVLYYADYEPARTGCVVVAYDLKSRKRIWTTHLRGIVVGSHSQYINLVNIAFDSKYIIVYGNEAFGRYIELVDPRSGETVGHRLVAKHEKAPAPPSRLEHDDAGRP